MPVSEKPLVISELPQSGKWFVAAGQSTSGQLYRDAGADYAFSHIEGSGSVALSMEEVLEKAILAALGEEVRVTASGRTDAGVHAVGQVCHFDTEVFVDEQKLCCKITPNFVGEALCLPPSDKKREALFLHLVT
mgnify:CR=1 FL=1